MKRKIIIGALAVCLVSTEVEAKQLVQIGRTQSNTIFFYEPSSIEREGRIITIWTSADHRADSTIPFATTRVQYKVNCQNINLTQSYVIKLSYNGEVIERIYIDPYDRVYYVPERNTIEERILRVACDF